jgi:hypothetical protein
MELVAVSGKRCFKTFCDHCGNITLQTLLSTKVGDFEEGKITYTLSGCQICEGFSLRRHPGDWTAPLRPGDVPPPKDISEQLWPEALTLPPEVPDRVRQIYQEARAIKQRSPSSFVVQIRRALEAVANEQGAEGNSLMAKTQWLIKQGLLPEVFAEMTHITRMLGNLGAHDAEKDVAPSDVQVVDEFFRAIIEYLYVARAKVAKVKALMGR